MAMPARSSPTARVDAVYIATPPGSHLEYALLACAARKPVYVEKPMARCHAECVEMVRAFSEAELPLFVAFYRRALPRFQKARDLVASGQLGPITGVSYKREQPFHRQIDPRNLPWRVQAEYSGGGVFVDIACHTLDILDYIFGPLEEVSGTAANVGSPYDVEDSVSMRFKVRSGAPGTAQWNFASEVDVDEIVIQGERGEVRLSTFGREPVELRTEAGARSLRDRESTAHRATDDRDGGSRSSGTGPMRKHGRLGSANFGDHGQGARGILRIARPWFLARSPGLAGEARSHLGRIPAPKKEPIDLAHQVHSRPVDRL